MHDCMTSYATSRASVLQAPMLCVYLDHTAGHSINSVRVASKRSMPWKALVAQRF